MRHLTLALAAAVFALPAWTGAWAQTPATSATCKDGTTWTGKSHAGACRGHKGVKSFDTAAAAPATATPAQPGTEVAPRPSAITAPAPTPATSPATSPAPAPAASAAKTTKSRARALPANAAPGGGPGKVWVNAESKVYHCPSDRYYGKTKTGEYMTESAAKAAGDKPAHKKACAAS